MSYGSDRFIVELEAERERIDDAIRALRGRRNPGRKPGAVNGNGRRKRRHLSATAKKRISDVMKLRWAERKKAAKK